MPIDVGYLHTHTFFSSTLESIVWYRIEPSDKRARDDKSECSSASVAIPRNNRFRWAGKTNVEIVKVYRREALLISRATRTATRTHMHCAFNFITFIHFFSSFYFVLFTLNVLAPGAFSFVSPFSTLFLLSPDSLFSLLLHEAYLLLCYGSAVRFFR